MRTHRRAQVVRSGIGAVALTAATAGFALSAASCNRAAGLRGAAAQTTPDAQEFHSEAQRLRAEGRHDEAVLMLARAIEQNPEMSIAHLDLGEMYLERAEYVEAERSLATAARQLRQRPTDRTLQYRAEYRHGFVLQVMGRLGEAIRAYARALNLEPESFDANLGAATTYLQLDGYSQARSYAEKAVALNPASGEAHANLGAVYSGLAQEATRSGRDEEATALLEKAVTEYESAAELMMLRPGLLMNWADSLGRLGRYQEMVNTLETVIRIEPGSALAWERLGYAQFKLRDYSESIESFRQSLRRDDTHYPAHNGIGVCLLNEWITGGRTNEQARIVALSHLRASLRVNPSQSRIVELVSRYGR